MISEISRSRLVFLGERHNSKAAHYYELKIIQSLYGKNKKIAIAMEMFDHDTQPFIDDYIAGNIDYNTFITKSRPWPNYELDYSPIVEFAKVNGIKVIAMNVPRGIRKKIVRSNSLDSLSPDDRQYIAKDINLNNKNYARYFNKSLPSNHPIKFRDRLLLASIVKDETMAESIVKFLNSHKDHKVIVISGSFHSDYGIAIPRNVLLRLPELSISLISLVPVAENELVRVSDYLSEVKRADFYIFSDDKKSY